MSTTSITLTRQTVEQMIPATFDKNKGFFSLVTVNWTEQMFYELPTITVELYIKNGTTDIKTPLFSRVIKTYNPNIKIKESWEHTRNVIDVPESCYLKLIPNFDNNAISARNSLIEIGIEEGELWEAPTTQFPIILSIGEEAGGTEQTIEGQTPISFISTNTSLIDWTLYGNSIQEGTPSPTSPKSVLGCGDFYETEPELKTLTGVPPFTISADGRPLVSWSIDGNAVQSGTPAPDAPVSVDGCGDRTENLFSSTVEQGTILGIDGAEIVSSSRVRSGAVTVQSATYTVSSSQYLLLVAGYSGTTYTGKIHEAINGATKITTITIPNGTDTIRLVWKNAADNADTTTIVPSDISNVMLNTGTTALPYEPFGYKLSLTSAGQTTPVYLGQVPTVRWIKKVVLDGTENWFATGGGDTLVYNTSINASGVPDSTAGSICTHLEYGDRYTQGQYDIGGTGALRVSAKGFASLAAFKQWLTDQYAAGTPVTVWYVLANEQTGIVNEPLMRIDSYADTLDSTQAGVVLPTMRGSNTLTVDTDVQPNNMSITYYEQLQKYIIPITNKGNTETIDLSQVYSNRKIKKLVLTGSIDENWREESSGTNKLFQLILANTGVTQLAICSHYTYNTISVSNTVTGFSITSNGLVLRIRPENVSTVYLTDFKTWLAQQYTAGTPLCVWYVLANETTSITNEPLHKIGTYTDTITKDQSGITIPVEKGLNTIEVETEVKPSNMEIIYQ